jgi:hypothetical protein
MKAPKTKEVLEAELQNYQRRLDDIEDMISEKKASTFS